MRCTTVHCRSSRSRSTSSTLCEELDQQRQLLELAHDAIIVRDPRYSSITYWNREAQEIYGYAGDEAYGYRLGSHVSDSELEYEDGSTHTVPILRRCRSRWSGACSCGRTRMVTSGWTAVPGLR